MSQPERSPAIETTQVATPRVPSVNTSPALVVTETSLPVVETSLPVVETSLPVVETTEIVAPRSPTITLEQTFGTNTSRPATIIAPRLPTVAVTEVESEFEVPTVIASSNVPTVISTPTPPTETSSSPEIIRLNLSPPTTPPVSSNQRNVQMASRPNVQTITPLDFNRLNNLSNLEKPYRVFELRTLLYQRELPTDGNRQELVDRLVENEYLFA
jgi:hypothetical protein